MTDEQIAEAVTQVLTGKKVYYVDLACFEIEASSQEEAANIAEARMKAGELPDIVNVEVKDGN